MNYSIPVRIESLEKRRRMVGTLHVIAGFYLLATSAAWVLQQNGAGIAGGLPFTAVALGALFYGFRRRKIDPQARYNGALRGLEAIGMALLALTQTGMAAFALFAWAALLVMMYFTEKNLFAQSALQLTGEGILVPGSPQPQLLPWQELENAVFRSDYVTLFRTDKRYVQLEVTETLTAEFIRDAQSFALQQIRKQAIPT